MSTRRRPCGGSEAEGTFPFDSPIASGTKSPPRRHPREKYRPRSDDGVRGWMGRNPLPVAGMHPTGLHGMTADEELLRSLPHRGMRWNTPLAGPHADRLLTSFQLSRGRTFVDLGCGWGGPLRRALRGSPAATGTGIDQNPTYTERANAGARTEGIDHRVRFLLGDIVRSTETGDRAICVGADHAWGGCRRSAPSLASPGRSGWASPLRLRVLGPPRLPRAYRCIREASGLARRTPLARPIDRVGGPVGRFGGPDRVGCLRGRVEPGPRGPCHRGPPFKPRAAGPSTTEAAPGGVRRGRSQGSGIRLCDPLGR